ncbi:periplasmic heavy metal sensor [Chitinophaga japonensis]|uniref:Heavy-metal resistance protein n=1 Tax=Chitinophaga japonensis TaxID=104662 RepID=A0A562T6Q8_CHIJA|nr:periplasmic heavy metal sensor [Chitinophaga japonensis]TWI88934.1 heavy-metal resistance protein [Chitinophaga japonensis]
MAIAKNKVLLIIVGVLLLTNIGMLLFFLNLKSPGGRFTRNIKGRQVFVKVLEEKVGFSPQQVNAYQELRSRHWTKMRPLMTDMRNAKDSFYRMLYRPEATDSALQNAAALIGRRQAAIDLQTFHHFQQVRNLCNASQRPAFDSLIHQVVYKMSAPFRRDRDSLRIRRIRR